MAAQFSELGICLEFLGRKRIYVCSINLNAENQSHCSTLFVLKLGFGLFDLWKVKKIPKSFQSVEQYLDSFVYPLLEDTRAELASSMELIHKAPFGEVISLDEAKPYGTFLYNVIIDEWKNRFSDHGGEPYRMLPGDILIFLDAHPETVSDLQRVGWTWNFASVTNLSENENAKDEENEESSTCTSFKVKAPKEIDVKDGTQKSLFVVFLANKTTNKRIWNSLHMFRNMKVIEEVLGACSVVSDVASQL
ncbi:unnamed protein product [Ilex paraguariensis]|uniref:DUF6469 domain-containing protein n=1 Tax=Ilex paraguariensis TaxID=185542 RepID=A0ABC8RDY9_9AQUA